MQWWCCHDDEGKKRQQPYPTHFNGEAKDVHGRCVRFMGWVDKGCPGMPRRGGNTGQPFVSGVGSGCMSPREAAA